MTFEKVQAIIANQLGIDEAEVQLTTDSVDRKSVV